MTASLPTSAAEPWVALEVAWAVGMDALGAPVDGLGNKWSRIGASLVVDILARLNEVGWGSAEIDRLIALAGGRSADPSWADTAPDARAAVLLDYVYRFLLPARCDIEQMFGWLTLVPSAVDEAAWRRLMTLWGAPGGDRAVAEFGTLRKWTAGLPGTVAPLLWAAGLSIEEARARITDRTLAGERLWLLAGLRGYRLSEDGEPGCPGTER